MIERLDQVEDNLKKTMIMVAQMQETMQYNDEEYELLRRFIYVNNLHLNPRDRSLISNFLDQTTKDQ